MKKLTPTQITILVAALQRADRRIEPLPDHIHAGIKARVINGLLSRQLIEAGDEGHIISDTGRAAIAGHVPDHAGTEVEVEAEIDTPAAAPTSKTKRGRLIELIQRPGGATLEELCKSTAWQAHTVRGCISGHLRKTRKLNITLSKKAGEPSRYGVSERPKALD